MSSRVFLCLQLGVLFLVTLETQGDAVPEVKVVDMSGASYDNKCCRDKSQEYINKPDNYCAVLFENAACDSCRKVFSGWDKGIKSGKEKFSWVSRYREDSTSVIVSPGCIFLGYDESTEDSDNKRTIATAVGRNDWVYKEFKVLLIDLKYLLKYRIISTDERTPRILK